LGSPQRARQAEGVPVNLQEFEDLTRSILRNKREEIIAYAAHKFAAEGRGLVRVMVDAEGDTTLSWLDLDDLKLLQKLGVPGQRQSLANQIETVSHYWPDNQVAIVVTDGDNELFSLRVKHAM
jgi:hypothetical protein